MQNDALDGQTPRWLGRVIGCRRERPGLAEQSIDAQALECRTLYSATPLLLDAVQIDVAEDAPDTNLDLSQYFSVDDGNQQTDYSLVTETGDNLFADKTLRQDGNLSLEYAEDRFGQASLTLHATNASGQSESLPVQISVRPLNDSPSTTGLLDVSVQTDVGRTVIDLFSAFDDAEDGSEGLTYSIAENTNPGLFDSVRIDHEQGRLILDYADGRTGSADLTILATDSGGLSVGLSSDGFTIHDQIFGQGQSDPETTHLGLRHSELWTSGRFHDRVDGEYRFDYVNFAKLDRYLATADPAHYHVFNIENSYYDNSPEGRDRFAELFNYVKQQRPDLDIGVYRIMPETQWYAPVNWETAQLHESLDITSWYTEHATRFETSFNSWQARNALFRTEQVSEEFSGQTVADLVDGINPHLYAFRRGNTDNDAPIWRVATLNANSNTIAIDGPSFEDVKTVKFHLSSDATLDNGLQKLKTYHVVNASGRTFQLALTEGGTPIDFDEDFSGRIYAGATDFSSVQHDPNVLNWKIYAEQNIAEAREYGKSVYPYLSPSLRGTSIQPLEYEFFRWQLEVIRPLADGVIIYEPQIYTGDHHIQQEWWRALEDFTGTLNGPSGSFTVNVTATPDVVPEPPNDDTSNDAPVANDDTLAAVEDTPLLVNESELLQNDSDSEPLSIPRFSQPDHGTLTRLPNGLLRYVPNTDFHGVDQFTYFASDGDADSNVANVEIVVAAANDAPVAQNDRFNAIEDTARKIEIEELIANDVDVDGDALSLQIVVSPQHGRVEVSEDGELIYTPRANYEGTDTFRYRVSDGEEVSNAALVVMNVVPVNDRPAAATDVLRTREDTPLLITANDLTRNDRDPEGDSLRVVTLAQPSHGNLGRGADGNLIYRPHRNFHGTDRFEYFVTDGNSRSEAVTVQLRVLPENDDPRAVEDRYVLQEGRVLRVTPEIGVLANDGDADGDALRARLLRAPSHGSVRLNQDGSFTYRATEGYEGLDQFSYVINDGQGGRNVGEVRISVAGEKEPRRFGETAREGDIREPDVRDRDSRDRNTRDRNTRDRNTRDPDPRDPDLNDLRGDVASEIERIKQQRRDSALRRGGRLPPWMRALPDFR